MFLAHRSPGNLRTDIQYAIQSVVIVSGGTDTGSVIVRVDRRPGKAWWRRLRRLIGFRDNFFLRYYGDVMRGASRDEDGAEGTELGLGCRPELSERSCILSNKKSPDDTIVARESNDPRIAGLIYIHAFTMGFVVMAFEMIGSRFLNPYFGSSIYTWASIISTVLIALSVGYFAGGRLADKMPNPVVLGWLIVAASGWFVAVPFIIEPLFAAIFTVIRDVRYGSLVSSFLLLTRLPWRTRCRTRWCWVG